MLLEAVPRTSVSSCHSGYGLSNAWEAGDMAVLRLFTPIVGRDDLLVYHQLGDKNIQYWTGVRDTYGQNHTLTHLLPCCRVLCGSIGLSCASIQYSSRPYLLRPFFVALRVSMHNHRFPKRLAGFSAGSVRVHRGVLLCWLD